MWVWGIAGVVVLGVGAWGTPPQNFFFTKCYFFTYFTTI